MRRRFKAKTGIPITKTAGDIARNRGFQKPFESRKAKRVRFGDAETDDSSIDHEASQSPICGAPKTSEYAYFRKVKDGAANDHCRPLHKEKEQFKSSKISSLLRESTKESEKLDPGINFSISRESAGPSSHKLFISPPVTRYGESNVIRRKELTHMTKERFPLLTETVTPVGQNTFSSPLNPVTEKSENQCIKKGIFSEKRKRMRQWVAHSASSEVEKLHEKGPDLVSFLLGRLIPKGNSDNDSSKENADNKSKSLTIHEPDNSEKGLSLSNNRDLHKELPYSSSERSTEIIVRQQDSYDSEFPSNHYQEGYLQKRMDQSERSSEIARKNWDSLYSEFPSSYDNERHLQHQTLDPYQHSYSRICHRSDTQRGFSFCLPFESFKPTSSFHFKDLDESGPVIGHGREEPYGNSLEWDFESRKHRSDHSTRQNVYPGLANAWNSSKHGTVDNMLDTQGFYPSPLFSRHCLFKPLPRYVPTSCFMQEVRPKFDDDNKYAMVEPGQFSLSLPRIPNCSSLVEDKNGEEFLSNSNIILSYRDPRWQKCDFWWNCLSGPEFFAENYPSRFHAWNFPESDNGSCSLSLPKGAPEESFTSYDDEGAFDNHLLPSTLHSPLDTFMNCPLLLNHVKQNILDQELSCDDYDSELGYRKML